MGGRVYQQVRRLYISVYLAQVTLKSLDETI